jgi:hypothetical protein
METDPGTAQTTIGERYVASSIEPLVALDPGLVKSFAGLLAQPSFQDIISSRLAEPFADLVAQPSVETAFGSQIAAMTKDLGFGSHFADLAAQPSVDSRRMGREPIACSVRARGTGVPSAELFAAWVAASTFFWLVGQWLHYMNRVDTNLHGVDTTVAVTVPAVWAAADVARRMYRCVLVLLLRLP